MEYKNIYHDLGMKSVINASGRMTRLGVSVIDDEVAQDMVEAAKHYVVIDELMEWSGKRIGELVGCADACVTSSASSGIALAVASLICSDSLNSVTNFQATLEKAKRREVILLKGHNINYSVPLTTMIELGGGKIVEVGYANKSSLDDISFAVTENTLAIFLVNSHYCVQNNMVTIPEVVAFANKKGIPVIIDAGADEDLSYYMNLGADFTIYSGSKAVCGPTSGYVLCKTVKLAENMRLQFKGIGRAMKIGKENIMGLVKAIEIYLTKSKIGNISVYDLEDFKDKVNQIKGVSCLVLQDEPGRKIYRAKLRFDEKLFGMNAVEVSEALISQSPSIYTRDTEASEGVLAIDPRPLNNQTELIEIYQRLLGLHEKARSIDVRHPSSVE